MSIETVYIHHCDQCGEIIDDKLCIICYEGSGCNSGAFVDLKGKKASYPCGELEFCSAECLIKHFTAFVNNVMTEVQRGKRT